MKRFAHSLWLFGLFFFSWVGSATETTRDCVSALEKLNHQIERNFFETRRDFHKYVETFPGTLFRDLSRLSVDGHWVDAGSGEGFALQDFYNRVVFDPEKAIRNAEPSFWVPRRINLDRALLREAGNTLNKKVPQDRGRITGVTYKMEREAPKIEGLRLLSGRFFEEIPNQEISSADIITDLYGVMSYSPRVDKVLSKYHSILKKGGRAYIFIGDYVESPDFTLSLRAMPHQESGWDSPFALSKVKKKNGETVSLLEWVMAIPGFKATLQANEVEPQPRANVIPGVIQRTTLVLEKADEITRIPSLRLLEADEGKPPLRFFEEVSD